MKSNKADFQASFFLCSEWCAYLFHYNHFLNYDCSGTAFNLRHDLHLHTALAHPDAPSTNGGSKFDSEWSLLGPRRTTGCARKARRHATNDPTSRSARRRKTIDRASTPSLGECLSSATSTDLTRKPARASSVPIDTQKVGGRTTSTLQRSDIEALFDMLDLSECGGGASESAVARVRPKSGSGLHEAACQTPTAFDDRRHQFLLKLSHYPPLISLLSPNVLDAAFRAVGHRKPLASSTETVVETSKDLVGDLIALLEDMQLVCPPPPRIVIELHD